MFAWKITFTVVDKGEHLLRLYLVESVKSTVEWVENIFSRITKLNLNNKPTFPSPLSDCDIYNLIQTPQDKIGQLILGLIPGIIEKAQTPIIINPILVMIPEIKIVLWTSITS